MWCNFSRVCSVNILQLFGDQMALVTTGLRTDVYRRTTLLQQCLQYRPVYARNNWW